MSVDLYERHGIGGVGTRAGLGPFLGYHHQQEEEQEQEQEDQQQQQQQQADGEELLLLDEEIVEEISDGGGINISLSDRDMDMTEDWELNSMSGETVGTESSKRRSERYDSSESSDSGVATLSPSDSPELISPYSPCCDCSSEPSDVGSCISESPLSSSESPTPLVDVEVSFIPEIGQSSPSPSSNTCFSSSCSSSLSSNSTSSLSPSSSSLLSSSPSAMTAVSSVLDTASTNKINVTNFISFQIPKTQSSLARFTNSTKILEPTKGLKTNNNTNNPFSCDARITSNNTTTINNNSNNNGSNGINAKKRIHNIFATALTYSKSSSDDHNNMPDLTLTQAEYQPIVKVPNLRATKQFILHEGQRNQVIILSVPKSTVSTKTDTPCSNKNTTPTKTTTTIKTNNNKNTSNSNTHKNSKYNNNHTTATTTTTEATISSSNNNTSTTKTKKTTTKKGCKDNSPLPTSPARKKPRISSSNIIPVPNNNNNNKTNNNYCNKNIESKPQFSPKSISSSSPFPQFHSSSGPKKTENSVEVGQRISELFHHPSSSPAEFSPPKLINDLESSLLSSSPINFPNSVSSDSSTDDLPTPPALEYIDDDRSNSASISSSSSSSSSLSSLSSSSSSSSLVGQIFLQLSNSDNSNSKFCAQSSSSISSSNSNNDSSPAPSPFSSSLSCCSSVSSSNSSAISVTSVPSISPGGTRKRKLQNNDNSTNSSSATTVISSKSTVTELTTFSESTTTNVSNSSSKSIITTTIITSNNKVTDPLAANKSNAESLKPNSCFWTDCPVAADPNLNILEHIQAFHVSPQKTKNEGFICLWKGCKVFNKKSCSRSWLERHVLLHGGNKPFKCIIPNCGLSFCSQKKLTWHVNTHITNGTTGTNGSMTNRNLQNSPSKAAARRKKLRLRHLRHHKGQHVDYFDKHTMEVIKYRLSTSVSIEEVNQHDCKFHSEVLGKRVLENQEPQLLVRWHPCDVFPDEWIPQSKYVAARLVPFRRIPRNKIRKLYPSLFPPERKVKAQRKWKKSTSDSSLTSSSASLYTSSSSSSSSASISSVSSVSSPARSVLDSDDNVKMESESSSASSSSSLGYCEFDETSNSSSNDEFDDWVHYLAQAYIS